MKSLGSLLAVIMIAILLIICLQSRVNLFGSQEISQHTNYDHANTVKQMLEIIRVQNETINLLENVISHNHNVPKLSDLVTTNHKQEESIRKLKNQLTELSQREHSTVDTPTNNLLPNSCCDSSPFTALKGSSLQQDCDSRYGMKLIELWKRNKQVWCEDSDSSATNMDKRSRLVCYPYHQEHKKLDGRGPDIFCEATNFFIDFAKVHGTSGNSKPHLGDQYLSFDQGSLFSTCQKTSKYQGQLFMPHNILQMRSFMRYFN